MSVLAVQDFRRSLPDPRWREYIMRARDRFLRQEAATAAEIRRVYLEAAQRVRADIERVTTGTLRERHLRDIAEALDQRAREINDRVLRAIYAGVYASVREAVDAGAGIGEEVLRAAYKPPEISRLFAAVNERAVAAVLSRTLHDGLRLSDRVWRVAENSRNAVRTIVEAAVASGQDSRSVARLVQQYLRPGVKTALRPETRRRLGVPSDVSYEAMRLAVTELNTAFHEGTVMAGRATPSYLGVLWRLSASHPRPDYCDYLATRNGGFWPRGNEPERPHPWCRCVILPVHEAIDKFIQRLREWVRNPYSQPDLERWYIGVREFLPRPTALLRVVTGATRGRLLAWTEVNKPGPVPDDVLDRALDELISAAEEAYLRPAFQTVPVRVMSASLDQNNRAHVWARLGDRQFAVDWPIDPGRRQDAEQILANIASSKDLLDFVKSLRQLSFRRPGSKADLVKAWHDTVWNLRVRLPASFREELEKRLFEPGSSRSKALAFRKQMRFSGVDDPEDRKRMTQAAEMAEKWLRRVLRGPMAKVEPVKILDVAPQGRAFYRTPDQRIQLYAQWEEGWKIGAHEAAGILIHEFGHHLDLGGDWGLVSRRLTSHWARRRVEGDAEEWRRSLREWGYWDEFFDRYVGRVYGEDHGREVLTMALQWLFDNPVKAVLLDPEHMALALGLVKGVGAR